jgi:hypothetical protein
MRILKHLQLQNHFSIYLSIFRVFICFHLLKDVANNWKYMDILYGKDSFIEGAPTIILEMIGISSSLLREHYQALLFVYLTAVILFLFGIGRNFTAFFLFILVEIIQRLNHLVLNGGDNLLKFALLYMVFADSFNYLVLYKKKNKPSNLRNFISNLSAYSICIHLCMAYFISAIHKIHADQWFNGVATYYIFQLERFKGTGLNSVLAKDGFFVTMSTYATLLIEIFFPVLIWFKQTRKLFMVTGILLHAGIYIFMMIHDFQIFFVAIYPFFFKNAEIKEFLVKLVNRYKLIHTIKVQLA